MSSHTGDHVAHPKKHAKKKAHPREGSIHTATSSIPTPSKATTTPSAPKTPTHKSSSGSTKQTTKKDPGASGTTHKRATHTGSSGGLKRTHRRKPHINATALQHRVLEKKRVGHGARLGANKPKSQTHTRKGKASTGHKSHAAHHAKIDGQSYDAFLRDYHAGLSWAVEYVAANPGVLSGSKPTHKKSTSRHKVVEAMPANGLGISNAENAAHHHLRSGTGSTTGSGTGSTTGKKGSTHTAKGATHPHSILGRNSTAFHPTHPAAPNPLATRAPHPQPA